MDHHKNYSRLHKLSCSVVQLLYTYTLLGTLLEIIVYCGICCRERNTSGYRDHWHEAWRFTNGAAPGAVAVSGTALDGMLACINAFVDNWNAVRVTFYNCAGAGPVSVVSKTPPFASCARLRADSWSGWSTVRALFDACARFTRSACSRMSFATCDERSMNACVEIKPSS